MGNMNQMLMGMGSAGGLDVTGGNVTDGIEDGAYTYFVFTNATSNSLVVTGGPFTVDVLAVAGGGGGGSGHAGGGGGGGLITVVAQPISAGTYAQSVGAGGPAGGPAAGSGNRGTADGGPTEFAPGSPQYNILAKGGGRGGGWGNNKYGEPGGSGGGNASSSGSGITWPGRSADAVPAPERWGGNGTAYGYQGGQNNNGQTSRGGSGGGGAGTEGQPIEPGYGYNYNPSSIPANHPNYPNGGGDGPGSQPIGTPIEMATGPFASTVWPASATHPHAWQWGAFGGHGKKVPWIPAPVIAPGIPAPESPGPAFTGAAGAAGYFAGGGGGGGHRPGADKNAYTPKGGGAGGIGGGGCGSWHDAPTPWYATPGAACVGAGGGGGGQQSSNGGTGGPGILVFRFRTDGS